jgi:carbonic anhydrase
MTKKEWIKKMGEHNTDKYEVVAFGVTQKPIDIAGMSKVGVNPRGHLSHITEYMGGKDPTVIVSVKEYKELLEIAGKYYTLLGNE